jgi:hypothetical protein
MTDDEVARFALLQLREAERIRAQIAGEALALANGSNDEPIAEVLSEGRRSTMPVMAAAAEPALFPYLLEEERFSDIRCAARLLRLR